MAMTMKSTIFWVIVPCSLETAWHFRGTCRLHLHCRRVSQARNQQKQAASFCCFFLAYSSALKVFLHSFGRCQTIQNYLYNVEELVGVELLTAVVMKSTIFWKSTDACHLFSRWHLAWLILPWRWRRYVPPKRLLTFSGLHGVIFQKTSSSYSIIFFHVSQGYLRTEC
jgi:hypothetical protein